MMPAVTSNDSGTAMLGMMVAHTVRRKMKITSTTRRDGDGHRHLHVVHRGVG